MGKRLSSADCERSSLNSFKQSINKKDLAVLIDEYNDFVYSTNLKKFRRNYFDYIMCKFTPDSFKTDRIY